MALHDGPRSEVDRAYAALGTRGAEHGRDSAGAVRERYLADPPETPDAAQWRTASAGRWLADYLTAASAGETIPRFKEVSYPLLSGGPDDRSPPQGPLPFVHDRLARW